jgi:hypothetical protein
MHDMAQSSQDNSLCGAGSNLVFGLTAISAQKILP